MLQEALLAKKYLGAKFGIGEKVPPGDYAIPVYTRGKKTFMKITVPENSILSGFQLFWDEKLTICFNTNKKPLFLKESKFSKRFRKLMNLNIND